MMSDWEREMMLSNNDIENRFRSLYERIESIEYRLGDIEHFNDPQYDSRIAKLHKYIAAYVMVNLELRNRLAEQLSEVELLKKVVTNTQELLNAERSRYRELERRINPPKTRYIKLGD